MLVITRREGEEVVIGDPAEPIGRVRIASIRGDRVRIAFDFPRHISVHRAEVAQEIADEALAERQLAKKREAVGSGEQAGGQPGGPLSVGDVYNPDAGRPTDIRPRKRAQPTERSGDDSQGPGASPGPENQAGG